MHLDTEDARELCTPAEFRLITDSESPLVNQFNRGGLLYRLRHARQMATMWRVRANYLKRFQYRQHHVSDRIEGNYATAHRKAQLFRDVAERYRARLAELSNIRRVGLNRHDATTIRESDGSQA